MRSAVIERKTSETEIYLRLDIDGSGEYEVETGVGFFDHMLELFAKHGSFDLSVGCKGDLNVDMHHTVEDIGICLGQAFNKALGEKKGIVRYGNMILPMDETLVIVALDLSGRAGLYYDVTPVAPMVSNFDARLFHEFFQSLCGRCGMNLHIKQLAAGENHHLFEGIFKAFAKALDMATTYDPRISGVLSTKGKFD
jgi:imidazoleglycerol-phosphate dehydratase